MSLEQGHLVGCACEISSSGMLLVSARCAAAGPDTMAAALSEIARLRALIESAKQNTDGGCAFCRQDPHTEGHAEDCGK